MRRSILLSPLAGCTVAVTFGVFLFACSSKEPAASAPEDTAPACIPYNAGPPAPEAGPPPEVGDDDDAALSGDATGSVDSSTIRKIARAEIDDIFRGCAQTHSCHGDDPGKAGLYLPSTGNWYKNVINVASATNPKMKRIVPGDPGNSWLVHKLTGNFCAFTKDCVGKDCGKREPNGEAALPAEDFQKIVEWIRQGALEL